MSKLNPEDFDVEGYVKVNERLAEFRNMYPEGLLTSFRTVEDGGIAFKTIVCRNKSEAEIYGVTGMAAATGHAFLDNDDYGEKMEEYTETVSVGRALANFGLRVEKAVASEEEMQLYKKKTKKEVVEDLDEEENDEKPLPKLRASKRFSGKTRASRFNS